MRKKILIVEDNVTLSQLQKSWLEKKGYAVSTAIDELAAQRLVAKYSYDLILSDVRLPQGNGIAFLEWLQRKHIDTPFVIMTEYAAYPDAVRAIRSGAKDYLPKPVYRDKLFELVEEQLGSSTVSREDSRVMYYRRNSAKALEMYRYAEVVAPSDMSVLIQGANGTGKESVAQTIHRNSNRKDMPFVAVNCGAIPKELAASYFFGHVKGAFTGAETDKQGFFHQAEGGTLFLDEIGNLPVEMQSLLLRVLQEHLYRPVGGIKEIRTHVRIVAATNLDMQQAIREGAFREDLYHRINEFEILVPALCECREDILPLAEYFRQRFSGELRKETEGFNEQARRDLQAYSWPGNVRELQHKVKRGVLLAGNKYISPGDLGLDLSEAGTVWNPLQLHDERAEKNRIMEALQQCGGNKRQAAGLLGIDYSTLYRKLKKYKLTE